jgi:hypothetical protein
MTIELTGASDEQSNNQGRGSRPAPGGAACELAWRRPARPATEGDHLPSSLFQTTAVALGRSFDSEECRTASLPRNRVVSTNTNAPAGSQESKIWQSRSNPTRSINSFERRSARSAADDCGIRERLIGRIEVHERNAGMIVGIVGPQGNRVIAHGSFEEGPNRSLNGDSLPAPAPLGQEPGPGLRPETPPRAEAWMKLGWQSLMIFSPELTPDIGSIFTEFERAFSESGKPN